jgi:hypothetical protein
VLPHPAGDDVVDREQVRAAVVIDHALGIAGGTRRIVECDGVPLVIRHLPSESWIVRGHERLVFDLADPLAWPGVLQIVVIDHEGLHFGERQRLLCHFGEFAIDDQHLGFAVVELERDDGGVEPRVHGVENRARHRHAVVALQHRWRVSEDRRHRIAALDATLRKCRGEPA